MKTKDIFKSGCLCELHTYKVTTRLRKKWNERKQRSGLPFKELAFVHKSINHIFEYIEINYLEDAVVRG